MFQSFNTMVYLPFDMIILEILTRLNARSIDRYKCVSREWRDGLSPFEFFFIILPMLKIIW
ncbi:putative F-box-like domain superfamily protein [Helianthus anomalus]